MQSVTVDLFMTKFLESFVSSMLTCRPEGSKPLAFILSKFVQIGRFRYFLIVQIPL
jgi:hypothetical protein